MDTASNRFNCQLHFSRKNRSPGDTTSISKGKFSNLPFAGIIMSDTEAKIESAGSGNGVRAAWQPKSRVMVAGMEHAADLSLRSFRHEAEIHAINCALQHTGWNRKRAAKLLSISYRSLLYKIRQHNIAPTALHS
jgi:DNA-binding NtrC family response regulator